MADWFWNWIARKVASHLAQGTDGSGKKVEDVYFLQGGRRGGTYPFKTVIWAADAANRAGLRGQPLEFVEADGTPAERVNLDGLRPRTSVDAALSREFAATRAEVVARGNR